MEVRKQEMDSCGNYLNGNMHETDLLACGYLKKNCEIDIRFTEKRKGARKASVIFGCFPEIKTFTEKVLIPYQDDNNMHACIYAKESIMMLCAI